MEIKCLLATQRIHCQAWTIQQMSQNMARVFRISYWIFIALSILSNQCVQRIFLPGDWGPSFRKLITNHVYIYRYLFNELYVNRAKKTVRIRFLFFEVPLKAKKVLIENRDAALESERINDFKRRMNTYSIW